jgi:hypothetical protein
MKKRIVIVLAIILLAAGIVLYRLCEGWTIIEMAAKLRSEWESTNCGHVTQRSRWLREPLFVLASCALSAGAT